MIRIERGEFNLKAFTTISLYLLCISLYASWFSPSGSNTVELKNINYYLFQITDWIPVFMIERNITERVVTVQKF